MNYLFCFIIAVIALAIAKIIDIIMEDRYLKKHAKR